MPCYLLPWTSLAGRFVERDWSVCMYQWMQFVVPETALNIGYSCGLLKDDLEELFVIDDETEEGTRKMLEESLKVMMMMIMADDDTSNDNPECDSSWMIRSINHHITSPFLTSASPRDLSAPPNPTRTTSIGLSPSSASHSTNDQKVNWKSYSPVIIWWFYSLETNTHAIQVAM